MLKYTLLLLLIYVLYYLGMILYDLFLKKEKTKAEDLPEEYALSGLVISPVENIKSVEIEDVENLKTPESYQKDIFRSTDQESNEEEPLDLEEIRKRFEAEQDIDGYESGAQNNLPAEILEPSSQDEVDENAFQDESNVPIMQDESSKSESEDAQIEETSQEPELEEHPNPMEEILRKEVAEKERQWQEYRYLSESSIEMVANYDGHKVYHSLM